MKRKDISDRSDIEVVVNRFYDKVRKDDLIGKMFDHVNWEAHLPVMYDFWDNALFYTGNYSGNPMAKHQLAHDRHPLTAEHFERWLQLFNTTVDENFSGKNARSLKERANSIAIIMQIKIVGDQFAGSAH